MPSIQSGIDFELFGRKKVLAGAGSFDCKFNCHVSFLSSKDQRQDPHTEEHQGSNDYVVEPAAGPQQDGGT